MGGVPEIRVMRERCVLCGDCVTLCPQSGEEAEGPVLAIEDGEVRVLAREGCIACFSCVEFCRAAAIVVSREYHTRDDQPEIHPSRPSSRII